MAIESTFKIPQAFEELIKTICSFKAEGILKELSVNGISNFNIDNPSERQSFVAKINTNSWGFQAEVIKQSLWTRYNTRIEFKKVA